MHISTIVDLKTGKDVVIPVWLLVVLHKSQLILYHKKKSFWGPVSRAKFWFKSDLASITKVTTFCLALPELTVLYGVVLEWVYLVGEQ